MTAIAIIGAGALGTYAMERLAALAWHKVLNVTSLDIQLFERTGNFGDGEVYNVHQPMTNLLNTSSGELALGADASVKNAQLLLLPEWTASFNDWCRQYYEKTGNILYNVKAGDAPPRAVYGKALKESLKHHINLLRTLGATISLIPSEVTEIGVGGDGGFIISASLNGKALSLNVDEVLMVTGHSRRSDDKESTSNYIANPYPVSLSCARSVIPPATQVGIRGMGLSAIDVILALTEGRGGQFKTDEKSPRQTALKYEACGDEPSNIIVSSRCGLFTRARSWLGAGNKRLRTRPWYFTYEAIDKLRRVGDVTVTHGKIDAYHSLMPLIVLEMAALFHAVAAGDVSRCPFSANGGINQYYEDLMAGKQVSISDIVNQANVESGNNVFFHTDDFFDPLARNTNTDPISAITSFIEFDNTQALLGAMKSPHKAASEGVWRDLRNVFSYAVDRGGLTPSSHKYFVETLYRYHNQLSNGASLLVMEKILALLRANVLDVTVSKNPHWSFDAKSEQWHANGNNGTMRQADILIEASIPSIGQDNYSSHLHMQMFRDGILQRFVNTLGSEKYVPGGVATDEQFHPSGPSKCRRESITVLGAQLDGAIFFQPSAAKLNCNDSNLNKIAAWANGIVSRVGHQKTKAGL